MFGAFAGRSSAALQADGPTQPQKQPGSGAFPAWTSNPQANGGDRHRRSALLHCTAPTDQSCLGHPNSTLHSQPSFVPSQHPKPQTLVVCTLPRQKPSFCLQPGTPSRLAASTGPTIPALVRLPHTSTCFTYAFDGGTPLSSVSASKPLVLTTHLVFSLAIVCRGSWVGDAGSGNQTVEADVLFLAPATVSATTSSSPIDSEPRAFPSITRLTPTSPPCHKAPRHGPDARDASHRLVGHACPA
jgi:hypothetical protein